MREFKVTQENKDENGVPRLLLIKCESREMSRVQLHESMWFMNSIRYSDIITLVHNHQKEELTQLALFAGHHFYLDYKNEKNEKILKVLTSKANTWWEGDILDDQGEVVAKAPSAEVLSLIREIPSRLLIRPEKLRRSTPSYLGKRMFNWVSKGGFTIYTKVCDCYHCKSHLKRLERDPDYLWYR